MNKIDLANLPTPIIKLENLAHSYRRIDGMDERV